MGPKLIRHGAIEPIITHRSTELLTPQPTFSSRGLEDSFLLNFVLGGWSPNLPWSYPLDPNVASPMVGPVGSTLPRFVQNAYAGTELTNAPLVVLISL